MTARRLCVTLLIGALITTLPPALEAAAEGPAAERDFDDDAWSDGLVDLRSLDLSRTDLAAHGFVERGLRVRIPEGGFRGFGPFDRLPLPEPEEAWYRYHVRLLDWNSASSGKLPGLSGLYSKSARGCIPSEPGSPGWSARGLFGAAGSQGAPPGHVPIGTYLYHLDQPGDCGESFYWPGADLEPGRWQCVEGHVRLNTPGVNDGSITGWLDGAQVFSRAGLAFRRADETGIGIREMWLNIYFGGSHPTPNPLSLLIDQVEVSTEGRVGCLDPFTDDNANIHVSSLTELHALGFLYGCGYREVCPDRKLSRGEIAAFFARILALPAATQDHFTDDTGSPFEDVINRLAESGITKGCDPPLNDMYCPDQGVSRAAFAAMTVRALGLPRTAPDAFSDDEGHWAESNINAFAEAGITKGCGSDRFCPDDIVTRAEAASFFVRMIRQYPLQALGLASVEPPPDWPPAGDPPLIPPEERD